MAECPDCKGRGFILKKMPKRISEKVCFVLERVKCETCTGLGTVSFSIAEKVQEFAKQRAVADRVEFEALVSRVKGAA